ncbi:MAG: hypothetical protein VX000_03460 [Myxococcota bacterium]|nr:hypothetical protein [Myxococcota bacterium]
MPLIAIPLALPADVVAVHAGDLDADGRDELVLVSQSHAAQSVDPVALTVIDLDGAGREERRTTLALGTTPLPMRELNTEESSFA